MFCLSFHLNVLEFFFSNFNGKNPSDLCVHLLDYFFTGFDNHQMYCGFVAWPSEMIAVSTICEENDQLWEYKIIRVCIKSYLDLGLILLSVTSLDPVPVSCTCDLSPTAEWLKPLALAAKLKNTHTHTHFMTKIHLLHAFIQITMMSSL